jgi:hypothetical protein
LRPRRLPQAQIATVEEEKITRYLLAGDHPAGRGEAAFFGRFGFTKENWQLLRDALLDHARFAGVVAVGETEFGQKFILEGRLTAPDGRRPRVRSVWFVPRGKTAPRLVTAYAVRGTER